MPRVTGSERDEGAVLVMVLVMTVILGVVACALATYATTGLRTSAVTDARTERVSAADAGLRVGVELLKKSPSACTGSVVINDLTVNVSCTAVSDASRLGPFRVTASVTVGSATLTGIADVQAYTPSGKVCGTTAEKCTVMVNSWSVG
jgi:Tfp pilus assembly protein PilX